MWRGIFRLFRLKYSQCLILSMETFSFGNVFQNHLEEIFDHPAYQRVAADIAEGIERCRETCSYFAICGGGSPSNKLFEHGTFAASETMACRLQIQAPADALLEHLEMKYHLMPS